jgi:hypothetical protein
MRLVCFTWWLITHPNSLLRKWITLPMTESFSLSLLLSKNGVPIWLRRNTISKWLQITRISSTSLAHEP